MKITIVKNNEFETIGMHIRTSKGVYSYPVFTWGCAESPCYFSKTIDTDAFDIEVIKIVEAQNKLRYVSELLMTISDAVTGAGIKIEGMKDGGFSLGNPKWYKEKEAKAKESVEKWMKQLEEAINERYK